MIADALGAKCPVFIAPAMNHGLWNHPQTRISEAKLKEWGSTNVNAITTNVLITNITTSSTFITTTSITTTTKTSRIEDNNEEVVLMHNYFIAFTVNLEYIDPIVNNQISFNKSFFNLVFQSNWLINGDAETGTCQSGNGVTHPTGWMYNGSITQVYYNNTAADLSSTDPGPSNRGNCYFYGQISAVTSMWQYINMTNSINSILIDNQTVYYNFSAWIGGYSNQKDNAQVSITFIDQANQKINNTITLGPVSVVDRGSITSLLFRQANGLLSIGARSCIVMATITRGAGTYNDGDIDNIALYFYQ
ncbi:unnamed protein product [Adineta steineri]|uniref:Uncharacterized protein n=1 Tax=Adineta steineri TaxID=433720 RepID=A0A814ZPL7_9BILA|nr:unnamed protein product [Adineta steineri]